MEAVDVIRTLWRRRIFVALVVVIALAVAILSAYKVSFSPPGLEKRALQVGAASSQILIDSPKSALVDGASLSKFEALSTRAKIYGEYLSSLAARRQIAKVAGVSARSITSAGPFSPQTGQFNYEAQSSENRASEILSEGAPNRLVFTGQEGVPILTVGSQAPTSAAAVNLANAAFVTLKRYVNDLSDQGADFKQAVTVRELGQPEGGTIGGSNNVILIFIAFLAVVAVGCTLIMVAPGFARRWKTLQANEDHDEDGSEEATAPEGPIPAPEDELLSIKPRHSAGLGHDPEGHRSEPHPARIP